MSQVINIEEAATWFSGYTRDKIHQIMEKSLELNPDYVDQLEELIQKAKIRGSESRMLRSKRWLDLEKIDLKEDSEVEEDECTMIVDHLENESYINDTSTPLTNTCKSLDIKSLQPELINRISVNDLKYFQIDNNTPLSNIPRLHHCRPTYPARDFRLIILKPTENEQAFIEILSNSISSVGCDDLQGCSGYFNKAGFNESFKNILNICYSYAISRYEKELSIFAAPEYNLKEIIFSEASCLARTRKAANGMSLRSIYGALCFALQDLRTSKYDDKSHSLVNKPLNTVSQLINPFMPITFDSLFISCVEATSEAYPVLLTALCNQWSGINAGDILKNYRRFIAAKEFLHSSLGRSYISLAEANPGNQINAVTLERVITSIREEKYELENNMEIIDIFMNLVLEISQKASLKLVLGINESTLSHSHEEHLIFVRQSFLIWKCILKNLPLLRVAAEADMFSTSVSTGKAKPDEIITPYFSNKIKFMPQSPSDYSVQDTGQGLQRVNNLRNVESCMTKIVQESIALAANDSVTPHSWVGLNVAHLGDQDVPNALVFIDKYNQISVILKAVYHVYKWLVNATSGQLDSWDSDGVWYNNISELYTSVDCLPTRFLQHFFVHGFNGSGDSGGSCIDGRLTSLWNWCSSIEYSPWYTFVLLSGLKGFNGEHFWDS